MRFFIGDVHGCALEFLELIEKILERDPKADIYSVGDLINKGPDTVGVLEIAKEFNVKPILGNHEAWFLRLVKKPPSKLREKDEILLGCFKGKEKKWAKWLGTWPYYRDLGDILVVHAGIDPRFEILDEMNRKVITTIRTWDGNGENLNNQGYDPPWFDTLEAMEWKQTIVFGHWAQMGLVKKHNCIGLDSGCVYGRELTAWCAEEDNFLRVKAKKMWRNP